jgi:protein SCO1/2
LNELAMTLKRRLTVLPILLAMAMAIANAVPVFAADISSSGIELTDENGEEVRLDNYSDRPYLVFFGYTYCPDICPLTLYYVGTTLKRLGPLADDLSVLFISVDPRRDTPEVLTKYTDAFHPAIIGLTGTYDQISQATEAFRTTFGYHVSEAGRERPLTMEEYQSDELVDSYVPYHSSQIYLMGTEGELLDIIGYGSEPDEMVARIKENISGLQ